MKQIQTIFSLGNYAKSLKVDKYTCKGACLAFLFLFLFLSVHAGIKMTATLCHGEAGIYVCNFHGNVYSFLMCLSIIFVIILSGSRIKCGALRCPIFGITQIWKYF